MEKQYNPKEVEGRIYRLWEEGGFFNPEKQAAKKAGKFSMVIPPPNVTGSLHMGHALNTVIQDILARSKRMQGFRTLWLPGTDHAGIATQNVVEKKSKKEDKTRFGLGREKFIEEVWQWKKQYGDIILGQLKKLGASCDWSRARFTMDEGYSQAVQTAFLHYFAKGWIYRSERVVNWCVRCQTSLSDLELEYKEEKGSLWFIKYPLAVSKDEYIVVATTRPETMLGDAAVAINPEDERYKNLVGQKVILPLVGREMPIVTDRLVDKEFGTGALKVTPAHDMTDWQMGQTHNLSIISVIDEKGRMNKNAPSVYQGLKISEARQKVVEDLQALGLIEKTEEYIHQVPKCYRCDSTVELLPSKQWFLKMEELAKIAAQAVEQGKIKFHPERWAKIYLDWLKNTRDWCISRQIWWGHKLPIFFCQENQEKFIAASQKPEKCLFCDRCQMQQSQDVLDTWFSSALWPFATLGWPEKTKDLQEFYPTDVLSTARDIINLWVARMVFSGLELDGEIPFSDVIIHATVITKEGKRMSKSLGTGVDPMDLIEKYGADATRFGLVWQASESQDMRFGEGDILAGKKFCNKIWNAARFVLQEIGEVQFENDEKPKAQTAEDQNILDAFETAAKKTDEFLTQFRFDMALQEIYHFFWHQFCDKYIEEAKKQLRESPDEIVGRPTKGVLIYVLVNSLKLLHPFLPFISEEIYQLLPINDKKLLIIEAWPR